MVCWLGSRVNMNILVHRCFFVKRATLSDGGSFGVIKKMDDPETVWCEMQNFHVCYFFVKNFH